MELNKVLMVGNLGRDPEGRDAGNSRVVGFSLCSNRKFKSASGEKKEVPCWIDVKVWGKTGELCEKYLHKGSQVLVEGYLEQESWEDKQTGAKRSKHVLVANNVQFGSKADSASGGDSRESRQSYAEPQPSRVDDQYTEPASDGEVEDDLPF